MQGTNKARLLLDLSRVFQNVSPCEIMWKLKQSLSMYLSMYLGVATFVKHDVTQEEDVRDFQYRLFSSGSNITDIFLWQVTLPTRSKIFVHGKIFFPLESHKIKFQSTELPRNIWEWASERTVLYYFVCPIFTLLSDILQIVSHFLLVLS